ncbi:hypothetical protein ACNJRW_09590 [Stenotrophomonas maltophilia]
MDAIEKRAREILAQNVGSLEVGGVVNPSGDLFLAESGVVQAIIAALTLPEGYVLVQETQLRHLLNDAITSVEFIAGRGQSKPLSRRVRDQAWALVESVPARRKVP